MFNIPLPDNSIDLITTFQSLEPNGNHEEQLIKELFRVSKKDFLDGTRLRER